MKIFKLRQNPYPFLILVTLISLSIIFSATWNFIKKRQGAVSKAPVETPAIPSYSGITVPFTVETVFQKGAEQKPLKLDKAFVYYNVYVYAPKELANKGTNLMLNPAHPAKWNASFDQFLKKLRVKEIKAKIKDGTVVHWIVPKEAEFSDPMMNRAPADAHLLVEVQFYNHALEEQNAGAKTPSTRN